MSDPCVTMAIMTMTVTMMMVTATTMVLLMLRKMKLAVMMTKTADNGDDTIYDNDDEMIAAMVI